MSEPNTTAGRAPDGRPSLARSLLHCALVLLCLCLLVFLVGRQGLRVDTTIEKRHSLKPETHRVLATIPDGTSVEVFGVIRSGAQEIAAARQSLEPQLALFADASRAIKVHHVLAERNPALLSELGITRLPTIALRVEGDSGADAKVVRTERLDEASITSALERLLKDELPIIDVVHGHGEMSPLDEETPEGLALALALLMEDNHVIRPLSLSDPGGIPQDTDLLLIAGPRSDLLPTELGRLAAWVASGGRLLLLLGPQYENSRLAEFPALEAWLSADLGVDVGKDVVKDLEAVGRDLRDLVLPPSSRGPHPIVAALNQQFAWPLARTVRPVPGSIPGVSSHVLLRSGPQSWAEKDQVGGRSSFDPGVDEAGPLPLGLAVSRQATNSTDARLVILGSSRFAGNESLPLVANRAVLLNSVAWLLAREELLEARNEEPADGTMVLTQKQASRILLASCLLPLALFGVGVAVIWHRRRS